MSDKYKASISGLLNGVRTTVELVIQDIDDHEPNALAIHEFPGRAGGIVENMGAKARSIRFKCFFGTYIGAPYENHEVVRDLLPQLTQKELTHPKYGIVKGDIQDLNTRHTDLKETAEMDITFIEDLLSNEQPQVQVSMPGWSEGAFLDGQDEQQSDLADDMAEDCGTDGASAASRALDAAKSIVSQYQDLSGKVRSYVSQIDTAVNKLESTLTLVTQPANTILATVHFAENLPGRVIGSIARCVERYAESYNALRNFPAQFQRSLKFSLGQLEASFRAFQSKAPAGSTRAVGETAAMTTVANHIRLASAHRLALEAAYGLSDDQSDRLVARKNEGEKSFDLLGNYMEPVRAGRLMTVNEIEATLASVMAAAQETVDIMRGVQTVKTAVSGLVDYTRKIKLEAEKIRQVDIDGVLPIHLICLKYNLPYNAAERLLAINPQIKHPNFVSGTISIYTA